MKLLSTLFITQSLTKPWVIGGLLFLAIFASGSTLFRILCLDVHVDKLLSGFILHVLT